MNKRRPSLYNEELLVNIIGFYINSVSHKQEEATFSSLEDKN